MGVVYEARQVSLNRPVALKLLPPGLGLTPQAVQRFQREAQAAAKLHHTHIVPVYAVGETDGSHYYAMELIDGQSLAAIVRDLRGGGSNPLLDVAMTQTAGEAPAPARDSPSAESTTSLGGTSLSDGSSGSRRWFETVARLVADVADALHYAHGRGVVHRDIKPANLLLASDGRLCVTDFGLAQVAQEPGMTVSGSFLGTPAYMSPEQIAAGRIKVDHRTDIYSLGTVLYEMLTFERPFPGEGREQILAGIMTKEPKGPRRINPRIPQDLETICLKAIEKDPDRRYASADAMAADLRTHLGHGLIAARRAGPLRRGIKWGRRHPVAVTAAAGLVAIAALAVLFQSWNAGAQSQRDVAEARVLLGQGEYRKALARVNEALLRAPSSVEARGVLAQVLLRIEHYREAFREATAVLEARPDDWNAHAVAAIAASLGPVAGVDFEAHAMAVERFAPRSADALYLRSLLTEDPVKRIQLLDGVLELDPSHTLALAERAMELSRIWQDFPDAVATAERLIAVRPRSAIGRRTLALVRYDAGDVEEAMREVEKAIVLDPGDPSNFRARARMRSSRGENREAVEDFTRAIEVDPAVYNAYVERAWSRLNLGQFDEMLADARQAIKINPDSSPANQVLIRALREDASRATEHREVLERFKKTVETYSIPSLRARAYYLIALDERASDFDTALDYIDRGIRVLPETLSGSGVSGSGRAGFYSLRIGMLRDRDGSEAIVEDCKRVAALRPVTPSEFAYRGQVLHEGCARPDLALADHDRAIELAPQWGWAFRWRASLHRAEGRFDEALADLGRAVELTPSNAGAREERGAVLADLEQEEAALEDFEAAAASALGGSVSGWSHADALIRLGRGEEALAIVDRNLEMAAGGSRRGPFDWIAKAVVLRQLGRVEEALAVAGKGLEVYRSNGDLNSVRANLLLLTPGRCDEAVVELRKAEGPAPSYFRVSFLQARIAREWAIWLARACPGHYDAATAQRLAERAAAADPRDVNAHRALAYAAYRRGDFPRARKAAEAAGRLIKAPKDDDPLLYFLLAMVDAKAGDRARAKAAFGRGVLRMERTYPKDPALQLVRDEAAEVIAASGGRARR